jgi:hypothetical protein
VELTVDPSKAGLELGKAASALQLLSRECGRAAPASARAEAHAQHFTGCQGKLAGIGGLSGNAEAALERILYQDQEEASALRQLLATVTSRSAPGISQDPACQGALHQLHAPAEKVHQSLGSLASALKMGGGLKESIGTLTGCLAGEKQITDVMGDLEKRSEQLHDALQTCANASAAQDARKQVIRSSPRTTYVADSYVTQFQRACDVLLKAKPAQGQSSLLELLKPAAPANAQEKESQSARYQRLFKLSRTLYSMLGGDPKPELTRKDYETCALPEETKAEDPGKAAGLTPENALRCLGRLSASVNTRGARVYKQRWLKADSGEMPSKEYGSGKNWAASTAKLLNIIQDLRPTGDPLAHRGEPFPPPPAEQGKPARPLMDQFLDFRSNYMKNYAASGSSEGVAEFDAYLDGVGDSFIKALDGLNKAQLRGLSRKISQKSDRFCDEVREARDKFFARKDSCSGSCQSVETAEKFLTSFSGADEPPAGAAATGAGS